MVEYDARSWLSEIELGKISFSEYWNDEELEKDKEWYILDGDFGKMESYLAKSGLVQQFNECITFLREKIKKNIQGVGADLACGNLWAEKYLLESGLVKKIYCVEYSQHRLLKIGPRVLKHYKIPRKKILLCLGSFYELKVPNRSLDFIFLSQAFHHADRPNSLLKEMRRVLKPDGTIMIMGEHIVLNEFKLRLIHSIKYLFSRVFPASVQKRVFGQPYEADKFIPEAKDLIRPDTTLGDHYYFRSEYKKMFSKFNFESYRISDKNSKLQAFILINKKK